MEELLRSVPSFSPAVASEEITSATYFAMAVIHTCHRLRESDNYSRNTATFPVHRDVASPPSFARILRSKGLTVELKYTEIQAVYNAHVTWP